MSCVRARFCRARPAHGPPSPLVRFFDDIDEDEEVAFGLPRDTSVADSIGALDSTSERRIVGVVRVRAPPPLPPSSLPSQT